MKKASIVPVLILAVMLVSGLACGLLDSITGQKLMDSSMEPTINNGQVCTIDKNAYTKDGPVRGDIIIFKSPQDPDRTLVKRVIALPGEKVETKDGKVYINTHILEEPYIMEEPAYTLSLLELLADEYFVLGDNRNRSTDSHVWGILPGENIIGKVLHCE